MLVFGSVNRFDWIFYLALFSILPMEAVELRGLELRHAAEALRRDKQVILTAVKQVQLGSQGFGWRLVG